MRNKYLIAGTAALACFGANLSQAQLLKVDINNTSRGDNTAPGYQAWNLATDLGSNSNRATRVFTNAANSPISCTVSQTTPVIGTANIGLKADWGNKDGNNTSTDPNAGYRLSADGVFAFNFSAGIPATNGGAFCLIVSNLSAGAHTITTYHNDEWGNHVNTTWHGSNNFMSSCVVSVGGAPVFTNTPSYYATNDFKCGFAYFTVNAIDGQPLIINFDPAHNSTSNLDFVILNGFAIDGPFPGTTATGAIPGDGNEHVFANNDSPTPGSAGTGFTTLSWTPSEFAVSHDVYFGTVSNAVNIATHASPEFKGNFTTNIWNTATNLDSALTYYWRIDEIDSTNGVSRGAVWRFRTRHIAFPTAEGYGRFARGGRGGVVIEVTNTNDYDTTIGEPVIPGSYRAAIEASGPRTVVFRISGLIRLKRPCTINNTNGYLTVAGQTAPGDGICLSGWRAGISSCSDVIMRFIRLRLGEASKQSMDGIGLGNSSDSVIDHCTISWTIDESTSSRQSGAVGSGSANITFQHNIISEALDHSYHYDDAQRATNGCTQCYQPHSFAGSISGEIASYHHNLLAHCTGRNWSMAGGLDQSSHYAGSLDIRNNVVYNWTSRTTDGGVQRGNYVNNYYKPYTNASYCVKWLFRLDAINPVWGTESYFFDGNVMEGQNYDSNNWQFGTAVFVGDGSTYATSNQLAGVRTNAEVFPSYVTTQTARDAFKVVLSDVGCNLPAADVIDQRVIGETLTKTVHYEGTNGPTYTIDGVPQPSQASPNRPGIIDATTDVHDVPTNAPNYPWPTYNTYNVDVDSDHDGLPDWWEILHGTNPNSSPGDFSDSNADPDGDGYSNLEDYLNWLAAPHATCAQDSSVNLDLSQFTAGFTNVPVYTVFSPTLGTVAILGDGKTAQFTPTPGTNGLAGFSFSVTDAVGSTLTNSIGIHVTPTVAPPLTAFQQWQMQYFNSTNSADADANADPDGDGQNNMAEFLSGTIPTNAISAFRIISAVRQSNDVVVTWTTAGGFTNAVQTVPGDVNGSYTTNFTDLSGPLIISGSGDVTTNYVDGGAATNVPSRYYRIRLVP
ncbi:MAG TPA: T9SS C-terminal target domain-containing protein [Verrucomicrobiae bacterium]|nr:T9SS C-terminal target domain-containing protein [Verrucomicrobiae bacterium]